MNFPRVSASGDEHYGGTVLLKDQLQHLFTELVQYMRSLCRNLNRPNHAAIFGFVRCIAEHFRCRCLQPQLRYRRPVGVPRRLYRVRARTACLMQTKCMVAAWGFVYHLHGNVHHSLVGEFGNEIRWEKDLTGEVFRRSSRLGG
jgi:hypothetical protein